MWFIIALTFRVFMMCEKDWINEKIDMYLPFITRCTECRMYNFGLVEGALWALFIHEIW